MGWCLPVATPVLADKSPVIIWDVIWKAIQAFDRTLGNSEGKKNLMLKSQTLGAFLKMWMEMDSASCIPVSYTNILDTKRHNPDFKRCMFVSYEEGFLFLFL